MWKMIETLDPNEAEAVMGSGDCRRFNAVSSQVRHRCQRRRVVRLSQSCTSNGLLE